MLYLDKIIAQLAYPLGFSLCLALLAGLLILLRWRRLGLTGLTVAVGWLWLWSLPVASDALRLSLEGHYAPLAVDALPTAEAVVVLGGGISPAPVEFPHPDLGAAADRVWHAARLYHAGKVPLIIASGGIIPWRGERSSEAEAMTQLLRDFGVPMAAIVLETDSRSTRENAVHTAQLLEQKGIGQVLLVTSALHMPRALATFRGAGIDAIAAPTDFEVWPEPNHALRWLPDAQALADSTRALKEYLGLWVYRWRGWAE